LIRPEALPLAAAQALLRPGEAALMVLPSYFGTHIMVLTREGLTWIADWRALLPLGDRLRVDPV